MNILRHLSCGAILFVTLLDSIYAPSAAAGTIVVHFSGTISQVGLGFVPVDQFHVGDTFEGSYTYDLSTPLIVDYGDGRSIYYPQQSFTLNVAGLTYAQDYHPFPGAYVLIVYNDYNFVGNIQDGLLFEAGSPTGPSLSGGSYTYQPYRGVLELAGAPVLFSNGSLPTGPLQLSAFTSSFFTLDVSPYPFGTDGGIFSAFSGSLTSLDIQAVSEPSAVVTLGNLSQTYDGAAKRVTVTTTPPDLAVTATYNGSAAPPTNAGSYTVVATITDPHYQGSATNTLVISQAMATVTFGNLSQTYDGTAKSVTLTTAPSGLAVNVTYNGSPNAPTNTGNYTVVVTVSDTNYQGSATNTLVIQVALANLDFDLPASLPLGAGCSGSACTITGGVYIVDQFIIPGGVLVKVVGDKPLQISANSVFIDGVLDANGGNGGATGVAGGGSGGMLPGANGDDGKTPDGTLITNGGFAAPTGQWGYLAGGGGGGSGGGGGGGGSTGAGYGAGPSGAGGNGLGSGVAGGQAVSGTSGLDGQGGGGGGGGLGGAPSQYIPYVGGNGGGGVSGAQGDPQISIFAGGGGGGHGGIDGTGTYGGQGGCGGGAIKVRSSSYIFVTTNGRISASGGQGNGASNSGYGGCGGGGGGGTVWLIAPSPHRSQSRLILGVPQRPASKMGVVRQVF